MIFRFLSMYEGARTLRIADGPDEVHKVLIAKLVMRQYERATLGILGID